MPPCRGPPHEKIPPPFPDGYSNCQHGLPLARHACRTRRDGEVVRAAARCSDDAPLGSQRLAGSVALVTGGASGIGKACAVRLARARRVGRRVRHAARAARGRRRRFALMAAAARGRRRARAGARGRARARQRRRLRTRAPLSRTSSRTSGGSTCSCTRPPSSASATRSRRRARASGTRSTTRTPRNVPRAARGGRAVPAAGAARAAACAGARSSSRRSMAWSTRQQLRVRRFKAVAAYLVRQVGCEYIRHGVIVNAAAPGRILTGRAGSRARGRRAARRGRRGGPRRVGGAHAARRVALGTPEDVAVWRLPRASAQPSSAKPRGRRRVHRELEVKGRCYRATPASDASDTTGSFARPLPRDLADEHRRAVACGDPSRSTPCGGAPCHPFAQAAAASVIRTSHPSAVLDALLDRRELPRAKGALAVLGRVA